MRVLMVSHVNTHPHNSGNTQRVYRECCQMMELGWQIDFLFLGGRIGVNTEEMEKFFGKEHFYCARTTSIAPKYQLKAIVRKSWDKKGLTRFIPLFYKEDEIYYKEAGESVQALLRKQKYDIIWLQYLMQSKVMENVGNDVFKIIDTHDVFANRNLMFQRKGRIPEWFYTTRGQERKALARADLAVAIQNKEEEYFRKLMKRQQTQCITIGDMVEFHKSKEGDEKVFGFIGAENDANVVAVKWLADKVLPIVHKMQPEYICIIAGGICNRVPDNEYYKKIGRVEQLSDYYDQISIAINPIQNGTGLNIKGIEALSYGKPLISTIIGSKGLADASEAMLVCEDEKQFAEQIVLLMQNRQRRMSMSEEAEKFIYRYNQKNKDALLEIEKMVLKKAKREVI